MMINMGLPHNQCAGNDFQEILGIRNTETIPQCSDGKFLGFQKSVADMNIVLPTTAQQPVKSKAKEGQWLDNQGVTLHIRWRCGFESSPSSLYQATS